MATSATTEVPSGPVDISNVQTDRYRSKSVGGLQGKGTLESNVRKQRPLGRSRRKNKLRVRG